MEDSDDLFLDVGDTVNFRVETEKWHDQAPAPLKTRNPEEPEPEPAIEYQPPYFIEVRCLVPQDLRVILTLN